jgi:NADPH-dependent 2,4-dienoyl-CoA reductase/sulfur reductase-like enzyme
VTLVEAGAELGGQFRLAGLQPRRGQILDLLAWFEGQLSKLQVKIELNTYLEPEDVARYDADVVVMATGSQPEPKGFQRGLPTRDGLPGVEMPNVFSAQDVMNRTAKPGKRVIVVDDEGNWKGCGTAWHLAEKGHEVTIVASADMIGAEIKRTSADLPLRRTLKKLGVRFRTESGVKAWHGDSATLIDFLDGSQERLIADALVLATTNVSERGLTEALAASGVEIHAVGDCVAAREANVAIFEGRRLARTL